MTDAERRQAERRRATIIMTYDDGLKFINTHKYTGLVIVHMHEGEPKQLQIANPKGWGEC